jgi:Relaxase/Mobilisation nuclease domain/Large polyvalent protein-associated domain 7
MIAKHVPMKSVKKSDFASLVNYLADDQAKQSRVVTASVTQCESNDLNAAVIEVMAIQGMNTRAESDKTYHLILSFRAGEHPEGDVLTAIEREVCVGLGYGEHQRISVAHDDTDNFHLHIAINKIHPTRLTIHNPYNDHKTLGRLCTALELQYGLERDNHSAVRVGSENRALDMEHHAGVESLLGWIKRECLKQLLAATSWPELHRVLQAYGLELQERGNGLVFCDQAGLMVKASSVARTLSKTKLLERFGNFKPPSDADPQHNHKHLKAQAPVKQYAAKPVRTGMDTTLLFSRYKNEQQGIAGYRAKAGQAARAKKARLIADLKSKATLKRATIKLTGGSRVEKKCLYAMISHSVKSELKSINEHYKQERERLTKQYQPLQWADWLRREATSDNPEALAALRARARVNREARGLKGNSNTVSASGGVLQKTRLNAVQDSITKKGTIIYRVGSSAVRDEGDRLKVSRGATREGLAAALCLAMERYGTHITVTGSAEFNAQIVEVAAKAKLPLMFTDAKLEAQRMALIKQASSNQQVNIHTLKDIGPEAEANKLMPVRQVIAASAFSPLSFAAADQYIKEREQKRLKILDILKHRRYTNADVGVMAFMGVRHSAGESLALLKRDEVILVMPIDEKTAQRLSRLAIGDPVTCKGLGIVKTRGKSR